MTWIDSMTRRLRGQNRFARVALAAESAHRALPVHEKYWSGTYAPEVARGIEIAWTFARGTVVDQTEAAACLETLKDVNGFYREEQLDLVAESVTASLRALQAMSGDDQEAALATARALMAVQSVAAYCEGLVLEARPAVRKKGTAMAEEEDWQLKAVQLVEGWKGVAQAEMFEPLNDKPPKWLVEWETIVADADG